MSEVNYSLYSLEELVKIKNELLDKYVIISRNIQTKKAMEKVFKQQRKIKDNYAKTKAVYNLKTLTEGMQVRFKDGNQSKVGVIAKICPKTVIVNEGNVQWQINTGLVRAVRKLKVA